MGTAVAALTMRGPVEPWAEPTPKNPFPPTIRVSMTISSRMQDEFSLHSLRMYGAMVAYRKTVPETVQAPYLTW
jgi:hypothetical protein